MSAGPDTHRQASRSRTPRWTWQGYAPLDAGVAARSASAMGDVAEGLRRWRSWSYLGIESVKNQYRRTVLGPWWLTIQTAVYVAGLAVLFAKIFHEPLHEFVPYVAGGFIGFTLLSGLTRSGAEIFVNNASTIQSTRQPLSMLIFQAVTIEVLQFLHNMIIVVFFLAIGLVSPHLSLLLVPPAVALIIVNGVALGMWLGPTVARFRDVGPFVLSILQVMVFFTPIFWHVDTIKHDDRSLLLGWNPFAYFLGVFRDPMLGNGLHLGTYVGAALITTVNLALAAVIFSRTRSRLPYWVS